MSVDVRVLLADALRAHRSRSSYSGGVQCSCGKWKWTHGHGWHDHFADVLLSLPGIAVVDTEVGIDKVAEAVCNAHSGDIEAWEITYDKGRDHWRRIARAALLAAAEATA